MAAVDKNQAIIDFLITCPSIRNSPLYFNFINAKNKNKQIVTLTNDKTMNRPYVDGSVLKRYSFTLIDFRSMATNPIVKQSGYQDENVADMLNVQEIIDWVTEQAEARVFPDFGEDMQIDSMEALSENPNLNGIDSSVSPALAKYSFTVRIEYLDKSKMIWR